MGPGCSESMLGIPARTTGMHFEKKLLAWLRLHFGWDYLNRSFEYCGSSRCSFSEM
jgi:hypothetical protein